MFHRTALLALAASACCTAAMAQSASPSMRQANMLGQLEWCQAQGFAGADAIPAQNKMLARAVRSWGPPGNGEELGRQGLMYKHDGSTMTMAESATIRHSTTQELCNEITSAAIRNIRGFER